MEASHTFVDSSVKRDILEACDHGRASGDWNPLLKRLNLALRDDELHGPFYLHANMAIAGGPEVYNQVVLEIDNANIQWMQDYWQSIGGFQTVQKKFAEFYGVEPEFPIHFPAHILAANEESNAAHPFTVAWFLHEYLPGIRKDSLEYVCGLEIVSGWQARFETIFRPASRLLLDAESDKKLQEMLTVFPFGATCTLYAIIHDAGHWLGYQQCLPQPPVFAQYMPPHWYGAMGELATDMAGVGLFTDMLPGVSAFVLHQRLFDYTYKTPSRDPLQNGLNTQFDMLGEAIAFENFRRHGALTPVGDKWHLDIEKTKVAALDLLTKLEALGKELEEDVASGYTEGIHEKGRAFIAQYVPWDDTRGWLASTELQQYVGSIMSLPLMLQRPMMDKYYTLQEQLPTLEQV